MKALRLILILAVGLLVANAPAYGYVVAPTAEAAAAYEAAEVSNMSKKELRQWKKQQRKQARAQKRAERRAKFLSWISKKFADDNDQLIAILLAFFLGGLGIHRVFLQSDPIIILWYLLTLGGFFGLIPLIDFIRLIMGQLDHYRGNDSLFRAFQSA
jgi:TM2 domain-containing membrane protein YozV